MMSNDDDVIESDGLQIHKAADLGLDLDSILDTATAERDEVLAEAEVYIKVPSWDGAVVCGYRLLGKKLVEQLGKRSGRGDPKADSEFLMRSCIGLYANHPTADAIIPITDGGSDQPLKYVAELGNKFPRMIDGEKRRQPFKDEYAAISYMFKGNEVALGNHAAKVFQWMTDTSAEVEGAVPGPRRAG